MKILVLEFITSIGGVQMVYKNILPYLVKKHDIYFNDPYNNEFISELEKIEGLKIINSYIRSKNSLGWSKNKLTNFRILIVNGYQYFIHLLRIIHIIRKNNISLLYVSGKKELLFAYLIKLITGTGYIYHSHGFSTHEDVSKFSKICINKANKVLAVSKDVESKLVKAGVNPKRVRVVYNGIDISRFKFDNNAEVNLKDNENRIKIISIGSLQYKKGLHILIKAVNHLISQGYKISLDIVGETPKGGNLKYEQELKNLISTESKPYISLLGFKSDIEKYINRSQLLVLPSLEESFGLVLIEAMLLSKPVIGSNIGGIPEVIENNCNGFVFNANDVEDLVDKLKMLYHDPKLCEFMGKNGKERVLQMFTSEIQADIICHEIEETTNAKVGT